MFRLKNKRVIPAHKYIYQYHYGRVPYNMQVHHKDGNTLNCNISNLELLTIDDNLKMRKWSKRHNTTKGMNSSKTK